MQFSSVNLRFALRQICVQSSPEVSPLKFVYGLDVCTKIRRRLTPKFIVRGEDVVGTQTKQDRQDLIEKVLIYCNRDKIRVTYKAIADLLDVRPQSMGKLLGEMRPEASWIVNQKTKRPTGYPDQLMHKDLFKNPRVISDQADLECELRKAAIL